MKIIFGTSNKRKVEDIRSVIGENGFNIDVLTLEDIGWNLGEIEENGSTLEENSLIKAKSILDFCKKNSILYPILTDDAGLFIDALNGRPGIYTARYADEEKKRTPSLPEHECICKVLRELEGIENRSAYYRCVVTCMYPNGNYFQKSAKTNGEISRIITEPVKKPYFYSIFEYQGISFCHLEEEMLKETYRFQALKKALIELEKDNNSYENSES